MPNRPTYEELELKIKGLEEQAEQNRQKEQALRLSEARFRTTIESLPFDLFVLDNSGRYVMQNPACQERWGNLIGKRPEDVAQDRDTLAIWQDNNRRAFSGETVTGEVRLFCNGKERICDNVISPVHENGRISGILGINIDITDRKQAEKELRESENRYRSLFHNNYAVMLLIDPETGDIVDANPAACAFYGYSREELKTKKIFEINTLSREEVFQEMEKAKSEQRNCFHFRHRLSNGDIRDVEVFSGPIPIGGKQILYSIIHDITRRKQAEKALSDKEAQLRNKATNLNEVNTALRILLKERQKDKANLEEQVLSNVKGLIFPYIERLKKTKLDNNQMSCIDILKSNLQSIVSPFSKKLSSKYLGLTPTEIRVAHLVKEGKTSKEIADFMCLSVKTVEFHRDNIREKLGIKKNKMNLRTFLLSM